MYEKAEAGGWKVPDGPERERFDHPVMATRPHPPGWEPGAVVRELPELISELGQWLYLDFDLDRQVAEAYERDPMRATRLVERVVHDAQSGRLRNPSGLLSSYLRSDERRPRDIAQHPEPDLS